MAHGNPKSIHTQNLPTQRPRIEVALMIGFMDHLGLRLHLTSTPSVDDNFPIIIRTDHALKIWSIWKLLMVMIFWMNEKKKEERHWSSQQIWRKSPFDVGQMLIEYFSIKVPTQPKVLTQPNLINKDQTDNITTHNSVSLKKVWSRQCHRLSICFTHLTIRYKSQEQIWLWDEQACLVWSTSGMICPMEYIETNFNRLILSKYGCERKWK